MLLLPPLLSPALPELDVRLFYALYGGASGDSGVLTGLALVLSAIGGGWAMLALIPLCLVERSRAVALSLTAVLAASGAAVFILKHLFVRDRPCVGLPAVHALCVAPTDPSFPSGHACGSFTVAAFVLVTIGAWGSAWPAAGRAALRVVLVVAALGIAWSRVYLGVHFPGDVAGGAILGAAAGAAGGSLYLRRFARQS